MALSSIESSSRSEENSGAWSANVAKVTFEQSIFNEIHTNHVLKLA
jgi:hypothetical protein